MGFYIVSDGSIAPYRVHIYPPTLINITALKDMVIGWKVADLIIIFGSIDVVLGEIDRMTLLDQFQLLLKAQTGRTGQFI